MYKNHQPYYHEVQITFTAIRPVNDEEIISRIKKAIRPIKGILKDTIEVFPTEPEPGDPADLM